MATRGDSSDRRTRITVHVQPGARRPGVAGRHGDAWKVKVSARPVEGRANAALIEVLADVLDIGRSSVEIVRGSSGRRKTVEILGLDQSTIDARLGAAGGTD